MIVSHHDQLMTFGFALIWSIVGEP